MARIDVHHHHLPTVWTRALAAASDVAGWDPGWHLPSWSLDATLAMMDDQAIETAVLSLSTPGVHFGDDRAARDLATAVNEAHAELVRDRPGRFGVFATTPLPDVDGALAAIAHAFDNLNADGVVLLANDRGTYLGDPSLEPVMAELDRRAAVVFVHPGVLPGPRVETVHPAFADFLLDTTRAALNLVLQGVTRRYSRIRFILSHAGGFVPYAAYRFADLAGANPLSPAGSTSSTREEILDELRGFYFDTALAASPTALPSLLAFARPGHVLFGSDWPYATEEDIRYFTDFLDAHEGLDADGRAAIDHGNARALLPRLATPATSR